MPPLQSEVLDDLATAFKDVWAMLYAQVPPDDEEAARLSGNLSSHTCRPPCRRDN